MACDFLFLKIGNFESNKVVILEIRFSPFLRICWFLLLFLFITPGFLWCRLSLSRESAWSMNEIFSGLSSAFPWVWHLFSKFPCKCSCFSNVLVFNVWLSKREMEKNEKRSWPLKFPESHFSQRKMGLQQDGVEEETGIMAAFLFVCISVISSRYQRSQHKSPAFRGQGPFCSPDLSTLCAGCSKNTRQGYMPRGWRWRCMAGTVLRADGSQLEPYWPSLLLEVAAFIISRVPKQLTSGRFF